MRLLFAEDEPDLNRIVCEKLKAEGYSVDACHDGKEAMDFLDMAEYDGAILDIMMPRADGFEVLQYMRNKGLQTPVLFLTARDAVADKVKGLDMGADDYLVKPFVLEDLMARVRALTRRSFNEADSKLTAMDLVMDTAAHTVTRAGQPIQLSAKEYQLLEYLLHNKGIVLSRDRIEDHIWNFDYEGGTNVVDVYISYLRKKIDEGFEEKLIRTVRGTGYQLRDE